jgi:hypothetical protein
MKSVPFYPKVLTLGSSYTENALIGEVILQEKIDGSQFGFGINDEGNFVSRSKNVNFLEGVKIPQMFQGAVDYTKSKLDVIKRIGKEVYFYCELVNTPKHNTLNYGRVPRNHLMLFDGLVNGKWLDRKKLTEVADMIEIELVPELKRGKINIEDIKALLTTVSCLGKEIIEGVVIKNYQQTIMLGGQVFPLFTKYVREEFKEKNALDWKIRSPRLALQDWINGFSNEARWRKAIIHLKEKGKLEQSPRDIGALMKLIQEDIEEEEKEDIKNYLYKVFINDIKRTSIKGFPQWYKDKLLENVKS